ncbi:hypothetical protein acdb102_17170 [Acidothermaceae bacterium B102]|nr:hypothetical protein acdb102_17170 [Acidothermaceae bacterium B102]
MYTSDLAAVAPQLFHLTAGDAWESIQEHGLRSATWLVRARSLDEERATTLLTAPREAIEVIGDPADPLGHATLRDQKPLTLSKLERLVEGITPENYIRLINDRVYFYMKAADVERVRGVRDAEGQPQLLLTLDSRRLLADYQGSVRVAKINTGATIGMQGRRGPRTWLAIDKFPGRATEVKEFTVLDGISDVTPYLVSAELWNAGEKVEVLHPAKAGAH